MTYTYPNGLIDFLKSNRSKDELLLCLKILQEFKANESQDEWVVHSFSTWMKLEQFEDYLKLLTGTDIETVDDNTAKEFLKEFKQQRP